MKLKFAILASALALFFVASATHVLAKDVTITGEAKCAKCMLHEGTACQTVIQVEKNGKTTTYYLVDNDVSKGFHENVCHEAKKVTATGTVSKEGKKKELTLTKIEVVK
jgi:hypothetical protein